MKYTPATNERLYSDLQTGDVFRFGHTNSERIKVKDGFINDNWNFNRDHHHPLTKVVILGRIEKKGFNPRGGC